MRSKKLSEQIIKTFKNSGFELSEPDVLLDSEFIIERSGEKFRSSMLTFESEHGKIMCLRPDLTVASSLNYLQKKTKSKIYYSGQAYRRSEKKNSDFVNDQLGIEIFGSKNQIKDDFKVISTILRSEGISVEIYPGEGKLKKQMEYANKIKSPAVILYGENEIKTGKPTLRNLVSGNEKSIATKDLANEIKKII